MGIHTIHFRDGSEETFVGEAKITRSVIVIEESDGNVATIERDAVKYHRLE